MRALLVTGCGCRREITVPPQQGRFIDIPMKVREDISPEGRWHPDSTVTMQRRTFEYEREIEDLDGRVAVYREVLG